MDIKIVGAIKKIETFYIVSITISYVLSIAENNHLASFRCTQVYLKNQTMGVSEKFEKCCAATASMLSINLSFQKKNFRSRHRQLSVTMES